MLQKLNNQGYTFTDNGRVIVVDKYGAVKRLTNLTLTTIGTTGPATLIGNVLNIPDYTEMYFGTVTSVGLSMPAAFTVTNSPVTTAGTLTVTGAGLVSQYIRGDGTLADFPGSTGGGSSVAYYLNGSVNQGIFGGNTYYQMSRTPIAGAGTNFTIGANGYIASFITDASDPSLISIPSGSWNIQFYMSANLSGGTPSFYIELYKYDGVSFTLISTGVTTPENITGGTSVDLYYTSIAVPTTTLTVTDRLAVRVYVNNGGRTITFYTEGTNLAEITTTFTTGLTALNGLTAQVQYFTTGTSGTDFTISSATATHTFNLPVASALNTGKLSNTDWVTFNAKQDALSLTTTGSSGASTLIGSTLNVPAYTLSGLGGVPTSRTLTVNGTAYDLSADRSWSVGTVTSVAALTLGTTGTDLSSTVANPTTTPVITLNVPTASALNRGALSSADWTTFNGKVGGSGTTNYVPKFTASGTIGNSQIFDNGTSVGIGTASPASTLEIYKSSGTNYLYVTNGASSSNTGVVLRYNSVDYMGMIGNFFTGELKIGGFNASSFFPTFYSNNAERMRLTPSGRLLIGTTTESTFLLDVNGTARINGVLQFGSTPTLESFNGNTMLKLTASLGLTISSDRWNSNTSSASYIQNGYSTKSFVIMPTANANYNAFDFSAGAAFNPTLSINYNQKLINGAMTINSTGIANFFGLDSRTTDNSASIANNVYAIYADATLGTNTSATRWAGYFVGRGYFSGNVGIGNNSIGGISAASVRLDVRGTTWFSADAYGQLEIIPTIGNGGETVIRQYTTAPRNGGDLRIRVDAQIQGGNLIIATNANNERMRVNAAGNVLIGTATDAGYKLDVNGTFRVQTNGSLLANTTISNLRVGSGAVGFTGLDVAASARFTGGTDYRFLSIGGGQFVLFVDAVNQSVGVGNNSTLNASAVLDLTSTTKGFLPPRMTTTQKNAITSPATGLVVYDTTLNKLSVYTGAGWETVTSV